MQIVRKLLDVFFSKIGIKFKDVLSFGYVDNREIFEKQFLRTWIVDIVQTLKNMLKNIWKIVRVALAMYYFPFEFLHVLCMSLVQRCVEFNYCSNHVCRSSIIVGCVFQRRASISKILFYSHMWTVEKSVKGLKIFENMDRGHRENIENDLKNNGRFACNASFSRWFSTCSMNFICAALRGFQTCF